MGSQCLQLHEVAPFDLLRPAPRTAQSAGYPTDTADLIERDGEWWLHVVVSVPAPDIPPSDQVVGVDLGITRPAVLSTNRFLGKKAWKAIEGRLFHLKRALQKKGTK